MKKRIGLWLGLAGALVACTLLIVFSGVKHRNDPVPPSDDEIDAMITRIMREAEPNTHVTLGAFDEGVSGTYTATSPETQAYSSGLILDAPRNVAVNVVLNEEAEDLPLMSPASLLSCIAEANDDLGAVTVTDRDGRHPFFLLSAVGDKMVVSKLGGFSYGEVYQIELHDSPFLCFEGKDPSIRSLTIEIEDDPAEPAEYDIRELRDGIVSIDRTKISDKALRDDGDLSFLYTGEIPFLGVGGVFFATKEGSPDDQLDFYGVVVSCERLGEKEKPKGVEGDVWQVVYKAPTITDVYRNFRMKGVRPFEIDDATVLLNEQLVLEQFRNSSLALAIGRTLVDEFGLTPTEIMNFMKEVNLSVNMDFVGNRLHFRVGLKLGNFKIDDGVYFSFDFGLEKITEYDVDFDIGIRTEWIVPVGVDYKVKMIEDTETAFYFKVVFDSRILDEIPSDADYTAQLQQEMEKCRAGETSGFSALDGENVTPSTSGTRTTFPLFEINSYYFTPLQIKFKASVYLDLGIQVMGLCRAETHSRKVDFNFTNMGGSGQADSEEIRGTSDWVVLFGGGAHAEAGFRMSLGISILGFYDYLHAKAYAEAFVNASFQGLLGFDWNVTDNEFSGYFCADLNLTIGLRAGLNFKVLCFDYNLSKTWATSLFRLKLDNAIERWCADAETAIELDGKQTVDLDETKCLRLEYFDGLTFSMKNKQYKAGDTYSVLSGLLVPQAAIDALSGRIFTYTSNDPTLLEVNEKGTIHVKDGTPNEFTASITVGVADAAGKVADRVVSVHFVAGDTKEVYAGETLIGDYRPGFTVTLPEPEKIRGKEFDHYSYDGHHYKAGDPFTLPLTADGAITLETHYNDLPLYRVYFYDGYNINVCFDEVYQGESATPPYPDLRDCHMDPGWTFVSWDRSFDNVQGETHVVGVYVKVD